MEDDRIIALFWARDEEAVRATEKKYGRYLMKIAYNILKDSEDSRESVNDTYLKAWNSIPPHRPDCLSAYLGKIAREVSIDMYRRQNREKRKMSRYAVSLSELEDCVSGGDSTEQTANVRLLADAVSTYLRKVSPEARSLFIGRYFFMDSIREIANYYGMSESKVKSMLHRTRTGLRQFLDKEGFDL